MYCDLLCILGIAPRPSSPSGSDGTSTSGGMLGSSGGPGPSVTSGLTATLGSSAGDASGVVVGSGLGVIPPSSAIPWVPLLTSDTSASGRLVVQPATATTSAATITSSSIASGAPPMSGFGVSPVVAAGVPAGAFMAEGLLPVPEKLAQKIIRLEFVEMRELMPEMWWREEEEVARSTLSWPRRKVGPVTDILQWLSCYAAMVGVLSRAYPQMVPELMAYQATIIKCCRDFEGLAWAQYDRVYRRQAAQTKDLHWSRLNPTLYSLCFAGKAKRHVACNFCLSDNHTSDHCPDNPTKVYLPWQQPMPMLGAPVLPAQKFRICHLFNARDGPRCTYRQCKFSHLCSLCKGTHPRSACERRINEGTEGSGRSYKRQRQE